MTETKEITYNKGMPIRCECGKVIGMLKDGKIYIKCRGCNHQVDIVKRAESQ